MSKPAHKQDNPEHAPGQIVTSPSAAVTDQTLSDYIHRKNVQMALEAVASEKKLTFDEWCEDSQVLYSTIETKYDLFCIVERTWKAAQENK